MKNRNLIGLASAGLLSPEALQEESTNIFLGSPLLVLGIIAGVIAIGFAFYSWSQLRGRQMASVFLALGLGLLLLDLGVVAVTFFTVDSVTKLIHDIGLLGGFLLALFSFSKMRRIVS